MKSLLFVTFIILSTGLLSGQTITGKVLDATTNEALVYVNIGIVGQPRGTITSEDGAFVLETAGLLVDATVRFSMIGYVAQTFTIQELTNGNGKIIQLENAPVQLSEVVVKPGKLRKVGITKYSRLGGLCGWSFNINELKEGFNSGKGHEIGARIELGSIPVQLKSLHIRLHKQSFNTSVYRLHIRNIANELPDFELMADDVQIFITKNSGWIEIDLSSYN